MEGILSKREIDNLLGDHKYIKSCYNKNKTKVCKFLDIEKSFCNKYKEHLDYFKIAQGCTCCERIKIK